MTTATQLLTNETRLGKKDMQLLSAISFKAFDVEAGVSGKTAADKIELLQYFSSFVVKLLKTGLVQSDEDRLALIKLAAKLERQAERLEILTGKVKVEDLQVIAERFGKKTQAAVGVTDSKER